MYGRVRDFTLTYKNNAVYVPMLPGHVWKQESDEVGPVPSDIMLVNKLSYNDDIEADGAMMGETGMLFYDQLRSMDIVPDNWYVTNLIKCQHPEWDTKTTTVTAGMIAEFRPLLQQEILLVQPKVILCLGVEALSAVLGHKITMKKAAGEVYKVSYPFPIRTDEPDCWDAYLQAQEDDGFPETDMREVTVIGIPHPHSVLRMGDRKSLDALNVNLEFFSEQLASLFPDSERQVVQKAEEKLDYRVIRSLAEYEALVEEIAETCEDNLIAIDAEWNGSHPQNHNTYLRCFQLSWKPFTAACIALAPQTDDCEIRRGYYYRGEEHKRLIESTKRILTGRRLAGHFIEADLEVLVPFGIDLRSGFSVPNDPVAYREKWLSGGACGFDTGRAAHAVSETSDLSLKEQAVLLTGAGRYDRELEDWLDRNTLKKSVRGLPLAEGSQKKKLDGYGIVPDEILYKYANYDADVTRRLALAYTKKLGADEYGNDCWQPFWIAMRALMPILEINRTGLLLNSDRLQELTAQYQERSEQLMEEIRTWARWPDFNPKSPFQMRELLFGAQYNRKKLSKKELEKIPEGMMPPEYVSVRPRGAKTMNLPPLFTTGRYPKRWDRVVQEHRDHLATPSTNKNTLAQLAFFHAKQPVVLPDGRKRTLNFRTILDKLRHWNTVAQTLRYVLRPPTTDETLEPVYDNDGELIYDSGIPSCVCDDGRVRTHIYPTKATGRWSSARPSLQNLGKRIEGTLQEVFQDEYRYPLRSIFQAPEGHVLIEADYIGAEIAGAAYMCNDANMLEHVRRNQLPEEHPDYYDIHSHVAVSAFRLNCPPTKSGLKSIGKEYLRMIAKTVLFGLFYGRSARAIAEGAKSEGILVSEYEAQAIIDQIDRDYPKLLPYFEQCEARAAYPQWLCNSFGRYRRFPQWLDREQLQRFGRQAKNFPIQGLVADAVNRAIDHLYVQRNKMKLRSRIVLQIHDAILMEVPDDEVKIVYEELFPRAMVESVSIISTDLDGRPRPNVPWRHLGIDLEVFREWGSPIQDLTIFGINKS